MASAWGSSWGSAWGSAWGAVSSNPPSTGNTYPVYAGVPEYDAYTQAEIERERIARKIGERASKVIDRVAREQAQRDELSGIAAAAELAAAFESSELKWRAKYEAALEAYTNLIRAEMARVAAERAAIEQERARKALVGRNAAIVLLLLYEH